MSIKPHWQDRAACLGQYTLFDSQAPEDMRAARDICNGWCPVTAECLADALDLELKPHYLRHGIRGGFDPEQRAAIARTLEGTR